MGIERVVIDSVSLYQVEPHDYVRLISDGEIFEGTVLDVADHGDTLALVLDDEETIGDTIDLENLSYDLKVDILGYERVEVS